MIALIGLLLPLWHSSFPPLPSRLVVDVNFPRGIANQSEPLVTTGFPGDADFLAVRYLDEQTAVLLYDVWGVGGPTSKPFPFRPGEPHRIEIEMPTLVHVPRVKSHEKRPLKVTLDGQTLLDEPVYFHRRRPEEIFFSANPLGGTLVRETFRGKLSLPDGRVASGGPECLFGSRDRLAWLAHERRLALVCRLAASIAIGFGATWLVAWGMTLRLAQFSARARGPTIFPGPAGPAPHGWFLATSAVCMLAFTAVMTGGTFRLIYPESFGHFYDYQALSLLQGRLDLPEPAHSPESFVFEGKHYLYFGLTPAVLRLPFVASKIAFGQLSRSFMLAYYAAFLAAVYMLLVHVSRRASGARSWPTPFAVVFYVAASGMGTTIFFLSSRAYIYHEAILCGAMFATWSGYFSLRYLAAPRGHAWLGALGCGIAAVHARPTVGLFALSLIGLVALVHFLNRGSAGVRRGHLAVGALAAAGLFSFNLVSYLKFKNFEGMPLRYNVQYHPARLAAIDGKNFHASNLGFNFDTYFVRPALGVRSTFPYFYMVGPNAQNYPAAKIDLADPTLAMPYTMPAVFLLAVAGGAFALVHWPEARTPIGLIIVAAFPLSVLLLTAIAVSERYTGDFCPPLVLLGAFGLQALDLLRGPWRQARSLFALLCLGSMLVTTCITLHYQGEIVWGVDEHVRQNYEHLRARVDAFFGASAPANATRT